MKNTINKLKTAAILILFVIFLNGAHAYSNGKGGNSPVSETKVNNITTNKDATSFKTITKKLPIEVKNIWHNVPSYDKYGNEITPRARLNMMMNELNKSSK